MSTVGVTSERMTSRKGIRNSTVSREEKSGTVPRARFRVVNSLMRFSVLASWRKQEVRPPPRGLPDLVGVRVPHVAPPHGHQDHRDLPLQDVETPSRGSHPRADRTNSRSETTASTSRAEQVTNSPAQTSPWLT